MHSRIIGTGKYLPEKILTNHDLEKMVDTSDEWIRARTGIERRHIAAEGEATSHLAEKAAGEALDAAGLGPGDIQMVVVGTCTPDLFFPNPACLLQERMGMTGPAFGVEAACSGFVYALTIADQFIRAGQVERSLVIGAETMSRLIDWTDRETCVLFGDGAGAVILEASEEPGVIYSDIGADGRYRSLLYADAGVSQVKESGPAELKMKGNEVFKVAVRTLEAMADKVPRREQSRAGRHRLVRAPPGEPPDHNGDRKTAGSRHGTGRLDRQRSREYLRRLDTHGIGYGGPGRANQAG